ncbi:substrate-binding domain-containing protein [Streptomyces spiralis]|uniref:substrate-binding domain-containing protein n=1 Tax=Streptomyces spiralis TaxID=66376 RepID=UPI00369F8B81
MCARPSCTTTRTPSSFRRCCARGLSVPEDLALISYDDVFAAPGAPPLTAVAPPKRAVGAAAVDLLLRRLRSGPALPVHRLELLPELKVRASCGGTPAS